MKVIKLKGVVVHVGKQQLDIGTYSPELKGIDVDLQEKSLADFKEKKKIICFIPSLDTSVCSTSAQKFNQKTENKPDVVVIYCSMDLPFAFQRICMNNPSNYDRIAFLSLFRHRQVAESFGVYLTDSPMSGLCARAIFVLNAENKILYTELVNEITQEPDYEKALTYL